MRNEVELEDYRLIDGNLFIVGNFGLYLTRIRETNLRF
jgi:hypothetical protein